MFLVNHSYDYNGNNNEKLYLFHFFSLEFLIGGELQLRHHVLKDYTGENLYMFHTGLPAKEKDFRGNVVSVQGQRGILSCFAAHPTMPSLVAAGAFSGDGQFECFSGQWYS